MGCAAQRGKFPPWTGTVATPLDGYSIPQAALRLECWMTNPPKPGSVGVLLDGRLIAVASLEDLKQAYHRLIELETGSDVASPRREREVNAGELVEKLLTYFDRYQVGSVAPIVVELEQALAAEYRRGIEEAGCWRES